MPLYASVPRSTALKWRAGSRCSILSDPSSIAVCLYSANESPRPTWCKRVGPLKLAIRHASTQSDMANRHAYPSETASSKSENYNEIDLDVLRRAHRLLSSPISATAFRKETLARQGKVANVENRRSLALEDLVLSGNEVLDSTKRSDKLVDLAIYCPDTTFSARTLVTALLDDPLSSDETLHRLLWERWSNHDRSDYLNIEHSASTSSLDNCLVIPSPFLSRFGIPIRITELPCPEITQKRPALSKFLSADVPILVRTLGLMQTSGTLRLVNPNAILVLDTPLDPASEIGKLVLIRVAEQHGLEPSRVVFLDTERALRGIGVFRSSAQASPSQKPEAIRQYQSDVLGSRIPSLIAALESTIKRGISILHADVRKALKVHLVDVERESIKAAELEMCYVRERVCALRARVLEEKARSSVAIVGSDVSMSISEGTVQKGETAKGPISSGIMHVSNSVRPTMDAFSWWRLPFVVDDISMRVDHAVEKVFSRTFEHGLVFHTGRLAALQSRLIEDTNAFLADLPPAFQSHILQNTLEQISSAPSFLLTAPNPSPLQSADSNDETRTQIPAPEPIDTSESGLLAPIRYRTGQLAHATRALHLAAQRRLLAAYSTLFVSAGGAAGSALVLHALDGTTATGAGILAALIGVRWAIGSWERAREAWWRDFSRVGEGLERDVQRALKDMLDRQVCIIPEEACKGLSELISKRDVQIGEFEDEVARVEGASERLGEGSLASQKTEEIGPASSR